MTIAIRTNGVEHRQAAHYIQRLMMGVLGLELSEERDTIRRYVVGHEDKARNILFHPVLLERMRKSGGALTLDDYTRQLAEHMGTPELAEVWAEAWKKVSNGTMKSKDGKFNVYMGLSSTEDEKPKEKTSNPPRLEPVFLRETWLMPKVDAVTEAEKNNYKLDFRLAGSKGPWWASFAPKGMHFDRNMRMTDEGTVKANGDDIELPAEFRRRSRSDVWSSATDASQARKKSQVHQPYSVSIANEPMLFAGGGDTNASQTPEVIRRPGGGGRLPGNATFQPGQQEQSTAATADEATASTPTKAGENNNSMSPGPSNNASPKGSPKGQHRSLGALATSWTASLLSMMRPGSSPSFSRSSKRAQQVSL